MRGMGNVVERTGRAAGADERRLLFVRKAVDPDAALLAELRRGAAGAAEWLVDAFGDRVYHLAMRITSNASDAEEVTQDTLWTVSRKIDTFRGEAAFRSWVFRIAANTAYQKLRRGRSRRSEVSWDDLAPVIDDKGKHTDPAGTCELKTILGVAIAGLPQGYRTAFLLHDVEGLSILEIAQTLQMKPGTIKSRVHRARLLLRSRLADYMSADLNVAQL